jgi:hypothetical protein
MMITTRRRRRHPTFHAESVAKRAACADGGEAVKGRPHPVAQFRASMSIGLGIFLSSIVIGGRVPLDEGQYDRLPAIMAALERIQWTPAVRIWLGVLPVQRLNACVNALTS